MKTDRPGRELKPLDSKSGVKTTSYSELYTHLTYKHLTWAASLENLLFAYEKIETQAQLISVFVFATLKVQSLNFLNPIFRASSHFLWLNSPIFVGPGRNT